MRQKYKNKTIIQLKLLQAAYIEMWIALYNIVSYYII